MQQLIIDYGTLFAFGAISVDLTFQIFRVWRRKTSGDISLWGYGLRFLSAFILFAKFFTLSDKYLILGQAVVIVLLTVYFILIIRYHTKTAIRKS